MTAIVVIITRVSKNTATAFANVRVIVILLKKFYEQLFVNLGLFLSHTERFIQRIPNRYTRIVCLNCFSNIVRQ